MKSHQASKEWLQPPVVINHLFFRYGALEIYFKK